MRNFADLPDSLPAARCVPGDEVMALPSRQKTRVRSIVTFDGEQPEAYPPMSVTLTLKDEIDLSRGEMLVSPSEPPCVSRHFEAMVVWFNEEPLALGRNYLIKHNVRMSRAKAKKIRFRVEYADARTRPGARAEDERHRGGRIRGCEPALFRRVRSQPDHRQLYSDRSDLERDGRRGDDSARSLRAIRGRAGGQRQLGNSVADAGRSRRIATRGMGISPP